MNELLKNTFNNEAEIYDQTTQYLLLGYNFLLDTLVEKIHKPKSAKFSILDLGCGTGNLAKILRERFPNAEIYALDYSPAMLNKAEGKSIEGIKYIQCDMFQMNDKHLPFFDVIISSYVFHNFVSLSEHKNIYQVINSHLAIMGEFILLDIIDLGDIDKKKNYEVNLTKCMREYGLSDNEIIKWMGILKVEDAPLSVDAIYTLLSDSMFENITIQPFEKYGSAIFTAHKKTDAIQLKAELLFNGLRENEIAKSIFLEQNPHEVWKTGNNGIFLSILNLDVLLSINHRANKSSSYELIKRGEENVLLKNGEVVTSNIKIMKIPDWYNIPIGDSAFSNFFVFEGNKFLHLAYKGCAFSLQEKCKFCSTKRRVDGVDNSPQDIVQAFALAHKDIPADIQICLGGGTYIPFEDNVQYFLKIIEGIRSIDRNIPIWVECTPPTTSDIDSLIDAGATAFGFNIEIWDTEIRSKICPGKSKISKGTYLKALEHAVQKLGPNKVGSCIIVGLDSYNSIIEAIDKLIELGVEPCILPYKRYNRTNLGEYIIPDGYQRDFVILSNYVAKQAYAKNIIFSENQGCLSCTCCTIMHDIQLKIN